MGRSIARLVTSCLEPWLGGCNNRAGLSPGSTSTRPCAGLILLNGRSTALAKVVTNQVAVVATQVVTNGSVVGATQKPGNMAEIGHDTSSISGSKLSAICSGDPERSIGMVAKVGHEASSGIGFLTATCFMLCFCSAQSRDVQALSGLGENLDN